MGSGIDQVRSGRSTDFLASRQSELLDEEEKSCRKGLLARPQCRRSKGERWEQICVDESNVSISTVAKMKSIAFSNSLRQRDREEALESI